tara:strand:+ start:9415 stop:10134 length:720 start_codon:yes stop_codon:yes gene_type:complete
MRKLAFIPTREEKDYPIKVFLEKAGWEVSLLIEKDSIFEAYSDALDEHKVMAKDTVIMCHDDIEVLMDVETFNQVIETNLTSNTGFIGVAGPQKLNKTGCWWHGLGREYPHPQSFLRGSVWHGESLAKCFPTYYGGYGQVEVVDGLFMAAKGGVLHSINTQKPKDFVGDWDYYDLYYSYQAHLKGKTNKVVPIMILHNSTGDGAMSDEWDGSRKAFINKYGSKLEDITLPHQSQLPTPA